MVNLRNWIRVNSLFLLDLIWSDPAIPFMALISDFPLTLILSSLRIHHPSCLLPSLIHYRLMYSPPLPPPEQNCLPRFIPLVDFCSFHTYTPWLCMYILYDFFLWCYLDGLDWNYLVLPAAIGIFFLIVYAWVGSRLMLWIPWLFECIFFFFSFIFWYCWSRWFCPCFLSWCFEITSSLYDLLYIHEYINHLTDQRLLMTVKRLLLL